MQVNVHIEQNMGYWECYQDENDTYNENEYEQEVEVEVEDKGMEEDIGCCFADPSDTFLYHLIYCPEIRHYTQCSSNNICNSK